MTCAKLAIISLLWVAWVMLNTALAADEENHKAKVFRLTPDFVTNLKLQGEPHYLQIRVEILVDNDEELELVKHNEPLLQDRLLSLFQRQTRHQLMSYEGKMALYNQALKVVRNTLIQETGKPVAKKILFSKMVVE